MTSPDIIGGTGGFVFFNLASALWPAIALAWPAISPVLPLIKRIPRRKRA